jgi:uncharacterized protein YbjT (DUF2867 family)
MVPDAAGRREAARVVLLAGATGLVGGECVRALAARPDVTEVIALVRRSLPAALRLPKVTERVVDFERLAEEAGELSPTHVVCALGTTIRTAGSREQFRRVDHDYVVALAHLGIDRGARHFVLVSSLGADPRSRVFYSRVKGDVEQAVRALPYRGLTIVRPSLLLGERDERRVGEAIAKRLAFLTPPRYKPVHARDVAAAIVEAVVEDRPGARIIESAEIRAPAARTGAT